MKATRSGIAIGLALALLVPGSVVGQEASPSDEPLTDSLVVQDATGDLYDGYTGEPTEGPAYTDITGLAVTVGAESLTVQYDVAATVPAAPDPAKMTVGYLLAIDTDGDNLPNYHIDIGSENGWRVNFATYDPPTGSLLDDAVVVDDSLTASVPLELLGSPSEMRFQAVMEALDTPDPNDPLGYIAWGDRVPDGEDEWLAPGESGTAAEATAGLLSVDDVVNNSEKTLKLKEVQRRVAAAYDGDATGIADPYFEQAVAVDWVKTCAQAPCVVLAPVLYEIYLQTEDEAFFEATVHVWNLSRKLHGEKSAKVFIEEVWPNNYPDHF